MPNDFQTQPSFLEDIKSLFSFHCYQRQPEFCMELKPLRPEFRIVA